MTKDLKRPAYLKEVVDGLISRLEGARTDEEFEHAYADGVAKLEEINSVKMELLAKGFPICSPVVYAYLQEAEGRIMNALVTKEDT